MKAIRVNEFGGPEVMGLEEIPAPIPSTGQVLVLVKAAGVNPVDTYIRSGQYAKKPSLPYTPGMDAGGVVESIGEGVAKVSVGNRVYVAGTLSGAYAEYVLCSEAQVYPLPNNVSFQQGAAMGVPYGIAYRALFHRAQARPGETVLIHGATGGVGIAAIQLSRSAGMSVIATGGSDNGIELLHRQGAHHVLDHRDPQHLDKILTLTLGKGVDVVLEVLANVNLAGDMKIVSQGGRIVVIGSRGIVEIDPRDVMVKEASILGILLFNTSEQELARIHAALVAGLENGTLTPVINQEFPLKEAPLAHTAVMKSGAHGKIVLTP